MSVIPNYIYGLHDPGGEHLYADRKGWITFTEKLGRDGTDGSGKDYRPWSSQGYGTIVRLNHGYGSTGTIPLPQFYGEFASRVARYVESSPGCTRWIVGNEPNHWQEWPDGQQIRPQDYAACFNLCAAAIHALPGHAGDQVIAAAIAPWTDKAGDWIAYSAQMLSGLVGCNGLALHAYTHFASPSLITSQDKMNPPYQDRLIEFQAYRQTLQMGVPEHMRHLPVYMTEIAQVIKVGDTIIGWEDVANGWIPAAYGDIDNWNQMHDTQKILCGCLYRWSTDDEWSIQRRPNLQADLRAAVAKGYRVPQVRSLPERTYIPVVSTASTPATPAPTQPLPPIQWDQRLTQRQVELIPYQPKAGEWYWRLVKGEYWTEKEHTFVVTLDQNGNRQPGVGVRFWNGGNLDKRTEAKPNDRWMTDFPMFDHGRSYGVKVLDGPSDAVFGMGLGSVEQPDWNIHVSYHFTFQWTQAPGRDVPVTPPPATPAPTPRFKLNDRLFTAGYVNLRRSPGYKGKAATDVMLTLDPGSVLHLIGGPKVADGLVWWQVTNPLQGWVAESDPGGAVLLTNAPASPPDEVPMLTHPVEEPSVREISQPFGVNEAYYKKFLYDGVPLLGHNGVDFKTPTGTRIRAADDGTVLEIKEEAEGFGLHLLVRHSWGDSLYAHLSRVLVAQGQKVVDGQPIAYSGNTGTSTGPHLHFGIRLKGYNRRDGWGGYDDPMPYLAQQVDSLNVLGIIEEAATEFGVDPDLYENLVFAESRFNVNARSSRGAVGPAQIMPNTFNEWAGRVGAKNIANPADNLRVGARYLAWLLEQFKGHQLKALYAYNFGIGNVQRGETIPIATQIYAYSILHGTEKDKATRRL